jgi:hypothetical protein
MTRRLYEIEAANRVLPLVRSIVRDVVEEFHTLRDSGRRQRELEAKPLLESAERGDLRRLRADVGVSSTRIERYLRELEGLGLELRDLETGLVDFPTLLCGEPAFYSWKPGDEDIRWWHTASQGFADRRPVEDGTPARSR